MNSDTVMYEGDDIYIEETPLGCFITSIDGKGTARISSLHDAMEVIKSLQKMIRIQYGDENE